MKALKLILGALVIFLFPKLEAQTNLEYEVYKNNEAIICLKIGASEFKLLLAEECEVAAYYFDQETYEFSYILSYSPQVMSMIKGVKVYRYFYDKENELIEFIKAGVVESEQFMSDMRNIKFEDNTTLIVSYDDNSKQALNNLAINDIKVRTVLNKSGKFLRMKEKEESEKK